jgi:hypothetical protein
MVEARVEEHMAEVHQLPTRPATEEGERAARAQSGAAGAA